MGLIWRLTLPLAAAVITVFILSLIGIPVTLGTWVVVLIGWLFLVNVVLWICNDDDLDWFD